MSSDKRNNTRGTSSIEETKEALTGKYVDRKYEENQIS